MEFFAAIVKFFQEGGLFIYPIALVFAIGIAITVERWRYLNKERAENLKAFDDFLPLLRTDDHEKMTLFTRDNTAPVSRMIGCGLDMMKVTQQRGDVEQAMSEGMMESVPRLEERTGYLAVLANVATLLGLLGTIIGLIAAFTAVANADPAEKAKLLSLSISVAMNTTAFGLIAAIPLLIFHALLTNKTNKIIGGIEMAGVKFLNVMTLNRAIQAGIPKESVQEFKLQENKRIDKQYKDNQIKDNQAKESQLTESQI
jgi:biopolymer transport protein ExbB/TolQ